MARADIPEKMFFRIGEVAELLGVEPHVLRYWESEFKMRPQRSSSGQRMYRRRDVEKFLKIQQLVHDQGFTIQGARKAMTDGPTTTPAPAPASDKVQTAVERVEALRDRVASIRARLLVPSLGDLPSTR